MRMMKRRLFRFTLPVLLLGSILLSGCAKEPEVSSVQTVTSTATVEEKGIYLDDYHQFWDILEKDYPYLPYLETRYPNLQEIRDNYEKKAAEINNLNDFYDLLQRLCREFDYFAHLCILSPDLYQMYYNIFINGSTNYLGMNTFREVLTDSNLASIYQVPQNDYVEQQNETLPAVEVKYYEDCDALWLLIHSFDHSLLERDRTVLADTLKQYPNTKHIIFDIQNNEGGDDYYWMTNLVLPLGGDINAWIDPPLFYRNTPRIEPFFRDAHSVPVSELNEVPKWVSDLKLDRCIVEEAYDRTLFLPFEPEPATAGQDAKRWLLINGNVYSSAEKFTIFCKSTGWATLVGQKTCGDGIGTSPIIIKLDHSGLIVRFCAIVAENNTTGQPSAYGGTEPDYPGGLTQCLEMIRAESGF